MRFIRIYTILLYVVFCFPLFAQTNTASGYFRYINKDTIRKHLLVLASDSLEGRETAQPGMEKAARYVSSCFSKYKLIPPVNNSYFQNLPLVIKKAEALSLIINNKKYEAGKDFYSSEIMINNMLNENELVFAGYGIVDSVSGWNDYQNIDVTGKIVFITDGEPLDKKGKPVITTDSAAGGWKTNTKRKLEIAKDQKAAAVLIFKSDFNFNSPSMKRWAERGKTELLESSSGSSQPVIYVSTGFANELMGLFGYSLSSFEKTAAKKNKFKPKIIQTKIEISNKPEITKCKNVLGYLEGTDKKDEVVVVSAHLDHLGKRDDIIYYGADDDGSGSASVLTMAEAFAKAKSEGNGPRRSILFITFSGEEKGLLGSEYYTLNPVFPLENTVVDLNIDMIGRVDTITRNTQYYSYIIGSDRLSKDLHLLNESSNNECCKLELDYRYNDPNDKQRLYSRSDHYNFAKHRIPVIFYFTGLHEDYHKPTDTVDKIDFDKTAAIARLIFNTAWEVANRDERIVPDTIVEP